MPSTSIARQESKTDRTYLSVSAALAAVLGLITYRLALGLLDRTELSTDEAQYWFWGLTPEFGAYSKPPVIGWIIRASTEFFGQMLAAVRLPSVLINAATAAVIFAVARRLAPSDGPRGGSPPHSPGVCRRRDLGPLPAVRPCLSPQL
jgi:Dolichyl-phosphate-mannose-protein mannosyltransferase